MMFQAAVAVEDPVTCERVVHYGCCDRDLLVRTGARTFAFCGVELTGWLEVHEPVTCALCVRTLAWNGCSTCPQVAWGNSDPDSPAN